MLKSKYLEELGVDAEICNWLKEDDERYEKYSEYEKEYGVFPPANWSFDNYFSRWLYCHLKDYLKDAEKVVDLDFYHFKFKGKDYTQKEVIEKILGTLETFITEKDNVFDLKEERKMIEDYQDAIRLLAEILPAIWW